MERSFRSYLFKIKETITKTKLLYCVLVVLSLSCLNDPVSIDGSDNHIINKYTLEINSQSSYSIEDDSLIYNSPLLYSGYINQDIGSSFSVISLIEREDFLSDICSIDSIQSVDLVLNSTSELKDTSLNEIKIQDDALSIVFQRGEIDLYDNIHTVTDLSLSPYNLVGAKLEVNLMDESDIFDQICSSNTDEDYAFSVHYDYDGDESDVSHVEFNSTNSFDSSLKPSIRVSYMSPDTVLDNRYIISPSSYVLGDKISGGMYFSNPSNNDQADSIYVVESDIENNVIDEEFNFLELQEISPILSSENTSTETVLGSIHISFSEDDLSYEPSLEDTISISIEDIIVYSYLPDPANDNFDSNENPDGTEGNDVYDDTEIWEDLGIDACPDSLETGNDDLFCANSTIESPYNIEGTEGNNLLDWEDIDSDGLWTDSAEGERWYDCGTDMDCDDGDITDDYNNDPSNDNYSIENNLTGTEGNFQYDTGETYFDIGPDGIENSNDGGETDGTFQPGEPFQDTGSDGTFDYDEPGYNIVGTEGNGIYDLGERFDDCGTDNECDDNNEIDDYNGDPNNDNYSSEFVTGTQGNGTYDVGEPWSDFGIDGLSDDQEMFNIPDNINHFQDIDLEFIISELGTIDFGTVLDSPGIRVSDVTGSPDEGIDIELSLFSSEEISALQFVIKHNPISVVTSSLATEYHLKYLDDKSFYSTSDFFNSNQMIIDESGNIREYLFQSSGYGVKTVLTFDNLPIYYNSVLDRSRLVLPISPSSFVAEEGAWIWPQSMNSDEFLTPYLIDKLDTLIHIDISSAVNDYMSLETEDQFKLVLFSPGITNNFSYIFYDYDKKPNIQLYISE